LPPDPPPPPLHDALPISPPTHSPSRPPAWSGGPSGTPLAPVEPHHAWRVNSVAARSDHGPRRPKGEIDSTVRLRFARCSVSTSRSEEHTSELQSPCNLVC